MPPTLTFIHHEGDYFDLALELVDWADFRLQVEEVMIAGGEVKIRPATSEEKLYLYLAELTLQRECEIFALRKALGRLEKMVESADEAEDLIQEAIFRARKAERAKGGTGNATTKTNL